MGNVYTFDFENLKTLLIINYIVLISSENINFPDINCKSCINIINKQLPKYCVKFIPIIIKH